MVQAREPQLAKALRQRYPVGTSKSDRGRVWTDEPMRGNLRRQFLANAADGVLRRQF